jgi:segregation and condensation protein A
MLAFDTETQQVYTESFDGPLELLLFLVRKQGVDIRTVRIASITDSYLHHVKQMSELRLDIAGEFLYLASTLCYLKSRELLPNVNSDSQEEEDEEDPMVIRERLAQQLIEYERYREASQMLIKRPLLNKDVFTKPADNIQTETVATTDIDTLQLLSIYRKILEQHQTTTFEHHITRARFSLKEMGEWIFDKLEEGFVTFSQFTLQWSHKPDKVICFLTVLELGRHQLIDIYQKNHLSKISIHKNYTQRPSLDFLFEEI